MLSELREFRRTRVQEVSATPTNITLRSGDFHQLGIQFTVRSVSHRVLGDVNIAIERYVPDGESARAVHLDIHLIM